MFHELDAALARLLHDSAAPTSLRDADVSFETPSGGYAPAQNTLNLFLHELHEERELRDTVPIVELRDGQYVQHMPPLRVRCAYAVTAWTGAGQGTGVRVGTEHMLIGETLAWLGQFSTLPPVYLQGALVDQAFPPPTLVAQPDSHRFSGPFWSALGVPPRPAFMLSVTLALQLASETVAGPPVTTIETGFATGGPGDERQVHIGGQVRGSDGQLIAAAEVRVSSAGLRTTSDSQGRYSVAGLRPGRHTLEVFAVGRQPQTHLVDVPGQLGSYDIILDPL